MKTKVEVIYYHLRCNEKTLELVAVRYGVNILGIRKRFAVAQRQKSYFTDISISYVSDADEFLCINVKQVKITARCDAFVLSGEGKDIDAAIKNLAENDFILADGLDRVCNWDDIRKLIYPETKKKMKK